MFNQPYIKSKIELFWREKIKKYILLLLLAFGLVACSNDKKTEKEVAEDTEQEETVVEETEEQETEEIVEVEEVSYKLIKLIAVI